MITTSRLETRGTGGPKGEMALSELIEDGILQEVTSTLVWLRDPGAKLLPENIRRFARRHFDKIWPILQCLHHEPPVSEYNIERIKAHPTNGKCRCWSTTALNHIYRA